MAKLNEIQLIFLEMDDVYRVVFVIFEEGDLNCVDSFVLEDFLHLIRRHSVVTLQQKDRIFIGWFGESVEVKLLIFETGNDCCFVFRTVAGDLYFLAVQYLEQRFFGERL